MSLIGANGESERIRAYSVAFSGGVWGHLIPAALWIGLGVTSYWLTNNPDWLNAASCIIVGAALLIPKAPTSLIAALCFAAVANRVVGYAIDGSWTPLFVWLIAGYYFREATLWASRIQR